MPAEFDRWAEEASRLMPIRTGVPVDARIRTEEQPIGISDILDRTLNIMIEPDTFESEDDTHRLERLVVCEESAAIVGGAGAIRHDAHCGFERKMDGVQCNAG